MNATAFVSLNRPVVLVKTLFRTGAVLAFICVVAGLLPAPAGAQDVQVPVGPDSTTYSVSPELRADADLFPDVSGFQGAELYRTDEATYELVIRYRTDGAVRRERRSLSASEVRELRAQVGKALQARRAQRKRGRSFTQEGRYGLTAATTVHGLAQGGLWAGATGADGDGAATLVLLGGGAGFFVPFLATRNARVTEGEADATFYGGLQGYGHALYLTLLAGDADVDGQVVAGVTGLLGAAEGTAGYLLARRNNWSGGHAEMLTYTGVTGNFVGLGLGTVLIGSDDIEGAGAARTLGGSALVGSLGGMYLGHRLGRTGRYTEGDARIYGQSIGQGVNLMGSFLSLGEYPSVRPTVLLLTGSAVGGGVLGNLLVRDRDFTGFEGNLVALGATAGSLLGLALSIQTDGEGAAVLQSLGSAAGFGLTYAVLQGDARRRAAPTTSALDLNVRVGPGLVPQPDPASAGGLADRLRPRLTVSASF
jgi:hypothetical protein